MQVLSDIDFFIVNQLYLGHVLRQCQNNILELVGALGSGKSVWVFICVSDDPKSFSPHFPLQNKQAALVHIQTSTTGTFQVRTCYISRTGRIKQRW